MLRIVLFFLFSGMLLGCGDGKPGSTGGNTKLLITTSIKPVSALVAAVAGESAEILQLIPDNSSPHSYSFKPSDIKKLKNADIIFRIDEHMEVMLNPVLNNFKDRVTIINLSEAKGIALHSMDGSHDHEEDLAHKEHSARMDFHIWTSPENALVMAKTVASALSKKDAKNANLYAKNLKQFEQTLQTTLSELKPKLAAHQQDKFIVFHNAWQYFADYFGLQKPLLVNEHEGILSGAKTLSQLRKKIDAENIKCVFTDYTVNPSALAVLKEGKQINHAEIDVLASEMSIDKYTYVKWLKDMGNTVSKCLTATK